MDTIRVFGPVPSRRLGQSVGINNIPPKVCSYSCVYCQLGVSWDMSAERQAFYDPNELLAEVVEKLDRAGANREGVDYLTLVADGEPTLDRNLGTLIGLLKPLGCKVALITNASLVADPQVRAQIAQADWVSLKVDSLDERIWRKIDRPHKTLSLGPILSGIRAFAAEYQGMLVTETMLVAGLNEEVREVAAFIAGLEPAVSFLSIPTRPPAVKWVRPPAEQAINRAFHCFQEHGLKTELLIGYEGNEFAYTGKVEADLLSITSVHPMREDAVREYLHKAQGSFSMVEQLVAEEKMIVSEYRGERFYLRKLPSLSPD
ncbi:radical SAM protein [Desulfogranum mediterraneum]|uniref:radical SAM protein n=1 Tax=Desulfogranum mediterraneum TaxID=160661 RepID=UPI000407D05E|nr:radical SAM protein [Desulfogranum mediterraneum]